MTEAQKEIRDQDLADAVHEAIRQLREAVTVAKKYGLRVEFDTEELAVSGAKGIRYIPMIRARISREF